MYIHIFIYVYIYIYTYAHYTYLAALRVLICCLRCLACGSYCSVAGCVSLWLWHHSQGPRPERCYPRYLQAAQRFLMCYNLKGLFFALKHPRLMFRRCFCFFWVHPNKCETPTCNSLQSLHQREEERREQGRRKVGPETLFQILKANTNISRQPLVYSCGFLAKSATLFFRQNSTSKYCACRTRGALSLVMVHLQADAKMHWKPPAV